MACRGVAQIGGGTLSITATAAGGATLPAVTHACPMGGPIWDALFFPTANALCDLTLPRGLQ